MAEHSRCHPGRPLPHGEFQPGSSTDDGFQRTKSAGFFFKSEISTLAPATKSIIFLFESFP